MPAPSKGQSLSLRLDPSLLKVTRLQLFFILHWSFPITIHFFFFLILNKENVCGPTFTSSKTWWPCSLSLIFLFPFSFVPSPVKLPLWPPHICSSGWPVTCILDSVINFQASPCPSSPSNIIHGLCERGRFGDVFPPCSIPVLNAWHPPSRQVINISKIKHSLENKLFIAYCVPCLPEKLVTNRIEREYRLPESSDSRRDHLQEKKNHCCVPPPGLALPCVYIVKEK